MEKGTRNELLPHQLYRSKPRSAAFRTTIIYEAVDAARRARRFHDELATNRSAGEGALGLTQWNFGALSGCHARNDAASAAASANVVILSMSGSHPLPDHAKRWIDLWLWLLDDRRPALVALFGVSHPKSKGIENFLHKAAANKRLAFSSHWFADEDAAKSELRSLTLKAATAEVGEQEGASTV
jgi:hypothetical protein